MSGEGKTTASSDPAREESEIDFATFEDTLWRDMLEASFRIKREHRRLARLLGSALKFNSQLRDGETVSANGIPLASAPCQVLGFSMYLLEFVGEALRGSARKSGKKTTAGQGPANQAAAAAPSSDGDSP